MQTPCVDRKWPLNIMALIAKVATSKLQSSVVRSFVVCCCWRHQWPSFAHLSPQMKYAQGRNELRGVRWHLEGQERALVHRERRVVPLLSLPWSSRSYSQICYQTIVVSICEEHVIINGCENCCNLGIFWAGTPRPSHPRVRWPSACTDVQSLGVLLHSTAEQWDSRPACARPAWMPPERLRAHSLLTVQFYRHYTQMA